MCVHFQLKAKGYVSFTTCFHKTNQFIQHAFSSRESMYKINPNEHVSSLVLSTTSPRWGPESTTWRSSRTSPARWWVKTNFAKYVDSFTAPAAVWPQKMILSVTKKFGCTIVCCDQCDQYASSWNGRQNIIGHGQLTSSRSRSRDSGLELETKVHTKVCNHGEGPY